ncbi:MAG: antitoxin Xre/MbcA/ParS toxin-binding domain-containing protein [Bryobacterales bacterium]
MPSKTQAKATTARDPNGSGLYARIAHALGSGRLRSDKDLERLVDQRLPTAVISSLLKQGLTEPEIHAVILPRRTLSHRKAKRENLTTEESDRAVRLARIVALGEEVFGDPRKSFRWLRSGKSRLAGRPPLDVVSTESGARLVEEMLYQIDEGMPG